MKPAIYFVLLTTSALGAPAWAQQAPVPAGDTEAARRQEIQEIRSEIQALQTRLDRLEASSGQTVAPGSASPQATAPAVTAAASPPPASPPPASPPAANPPTTSLPTWLQGTTIGAKAFLNTSYIDQKADGADTSQTGFQTELKRFYLIVDHKFSDTFSANLTTDFRYNTNGTTRDTLVYVKKAWLQARFGPEFYVRVGASDMPWVPFVEDIYGYRYVENVLIDRTKFGTSTDWGVHVGGTIGDGLLSYAASMVDGAGFKTLSRNSDTVDFEGRVSLQPVKGLTFAVGGYSGKLGKSIANQPATPHTATRFNALAAYVGGPVRVGAEYFWAKNWNQVASEQGDESSGWGGFASFAFTSRFSAFGRYDHVKPSRQANPKLVEDYFNLGLSYALVKNVDLAMVYKRDAADHGLINTSNGTIGGVNRGTYDEFGLWAQFKF